MKIYNYMEKIVSELLSDILIQRSDLCKCEKCRLEIMARTLNHLPPRYLITQEGKAHSRIQGVDNQFKADALREMTQAIETVKSSLPH